ncbi:putative pantothenate transporter liz1 [Tricladium varicosporioides]|nr:putative pantothenate transporter liz1 [Hymenoscyphus varicosporioides]
MLDGKVNYGSVDPVPAKSGATSESSITNSGKENKVPWWSYIWDYDPTRTHTERKFIQKLDLSLLTILSLGYFIKNLDQTNISNAYVSGMKEDLKMNANQINLIDVAWTTGYVIAIRFFVGLVESIFYPAAHFLIGSWYKPSELGKRACIFHASSAAASMFSGYLQAAVYKGLNGTLGKAGWQWLFIMDGIISAPICLAGFFLIPDLPENTRAFYLRQEDGDLARKRMDDIGRAPRQKLGWSILKRVFTRWHVWVLAVLYIIFINTGPSSSVQPLALWLKAKKYPVSQINIIPTGQSAVQLVTTVGFAILSDYWRNRALVMAIATSLGFLSYLLLAIWTIPIGLQWFAYFLTRAAVAYGPLSMSWANEICGSDAEERALVLGIMNASGYAFNAWLPLLTYPAKQAPRFRKGFIFSTGAYAVQGLWTGVVWWLWRWESRKEQKKGRESEVDEVEEARGEELSR